MEVKATINWDELFMGIAALASMRSKDPSTKHGACIVGQDKRVVSIGYNGMPKGEDSYPWSRENVDGIGNKYNFVLHAEQNAILNAPDRMSLINSVIYVFSPKGYLPCSDICMKMIVQCGIKEVVLAYFIDANTDKYDWKPTLHMSKVSGVVIRDLGKSFSKPSFLKIANEFSAISQFIS
jgi:dCMP deaminase